MSDVTNHWVIEEFTEVDRDVLLTAQHGPTCCQDLDTAGYGDASLEVESVQSVAAKTTSRRASSKRGTGDAQ